MLFVRPPTEEEYAEIRSMLQHAVKRIRRRAQIILLSSQGHTVTEITAILGTARSTIRLWINRFNVAGPARLYGMRRTGDTQSMGEHGIITHHSNPEEPCQAYKTPARRVQQ
jgi:transposase